MTGCGRNIVDYICSYSFEVVNESDSEVIAITVGNGVVIWPGRSQQIESFGFLCGLHTILKDDIHYGNNGLILNPQDHRIIVDEVFMPETIWKREYWEFDNSEERRATYTLTITNELIETILAEQQGQ